MMNMSNTTPRAEVIRMLKQWIHDGTLAAGEPLPAERALAAQLGVPRTTVRRAIAVLEKEGVVSPCHGRTRLVNEQRGSSSLMQQTIVILGDAFTPHPALVDGGYSCFVGFGAQEEIQRRRHYAMVISPDRLDDDTVQYLSTTDLTGILVPEGTHDRFSNAVIDCFKSARVPVVAAGDSSAAQGFDRVVSDHDDGAHQLCTYFIEQGCRRILLALRGRVKAYWTEARKNGYRRAMADAGLAPLPVLETVPFAEPKGLDPAEVCEAWAHYWAGYLFPYFTGDTPVDAIMVTNDGDALFVAAACRLLGREPNKDIRIGGYDNFWFHSWMRPYEDSCPMASVDRRNTEQGAEMVRLLLERRAGKLPAGPQVRLVKPRLVLADEMQGRAARLASHPHPG